VASAKSRKCEATMTPNVCRSLAELRPNSHMLPSRTEPNIRPNSSAELRQVRPISIVQARNNDLCLMLSGMVSFTEKYTMLVVETNWAQFSYLVSKAVWSSM